MMPRQRAQKATSSAVKLKQPDRSAPDPSRETLLEIAAQRGLLKTNDGNEGKQEEELDPPIGRLGESVMWSISLAMLHFTFDVLVQHQYAVEISWRTVARHSFQAFAVILVLFYTLHPHPNPSIFVPSLPSLLHQILFFVTSIAAGCYLIYITNEHGYFAVMKQAPSLGVFWIWAVIELELKWAVGSLSCCLAYLWLGGYSYR